MYIHIRTLFYSHPYIAASWLQTDHNRQWTIGVHCMCICVRLNNNKVNILSRRLNAPKLVDILDPFSCYQLDFLFWEYHINFFLSWRWNTVRILIFVCFFSCLQGKYNVYSVLVAHVPKLCMCGTPPTSLRSLWYSTEKWSKETISYGLLSSCRSN